MSIAICVLLGISNYGQNKTPPSKYIAQLWTAHAWTSIANRHAYVHGCALDICTLNMMAIASNRLRYIHCIRCGLWVFFVPQYFHGLFTKKIFLPNNEFTNTTTFLPIWAWRSEYKKMPKEGCKNLNRATYISFMSHCINKLQVLQYVSLTESSPSCQCFTVTITYSYLNVKNLRVFPSSAAEQKRT